MRKPIKFSAFVGRIDYELKRDAELRVCYSGTPAQLIAAGVASSEMFERHPRGQDAARRRRRSTPVGSQAFRSSRFAILQAR